jgi:hypothetical protein
MYTDTKELQERIEAQEKKDRYVASECLKWLLRNGKDLNIVATEIKDGVDLRCSVTDIRNDNHVRFNVEIKERYKNNFGLSKYPYAELKVSKLANMRRSTDYDTTRLYYMVLLNQNTCYLFNLDSLDWENIEKGWWHVKKTQLDDNSDYEDVEIYKIPYSMAVAVCNCKNFFKEYELNLDK